MRFNRENSWAMSLQLFLGHQQSSMSRHIVTQWAASAVLTAIFRRLVVNLAHVADSRWRSAFWPFRPRASTPIRPSACDPQSRRP